MRLYLSHVWKRVHDEMAYKKKHLSGNQEHLSGTFIRKSGYYCKIPKKEMNKWNQIDFRIFIYLVNLNVILFIYISCFREKKKNK